MLENKQIQAYREKQYEEEYIVLLSQNTECYFISLQCKAYKYSIEKL